MHWESSVRLADLVEVRGRFHRSVHLPRDFEATTHHGKYFASPAILEIARRILAELGERHGTRAWTLTGPYGTGKSAFALFLTQILASGRPTHREVRSLRRQYRHRARLMRPLLIQAERGPLLPKLLTTLEFIGGASGDQWVTRRAAALRRAQRPEPGKVVELLSSAAERSSGGLALVVDELGKYLEYAAQRSDEEDLFLLQQIAEMAARSRKPLLFLAVLHTGFSDYVQGGGAARRAEWQKVQGRFRDIPFSLPDEQLLGLVGMALKTRFNAGIQDAYRERFQAITANPDFQLAAERFGHRETLSGCLPLHPAVSLVLWPLFRSKIAQNERSLFAFLTSHEPHGFQEFLQSATTSSNEAPLYDLPRLYDYVTGALGLASITGRDARQWSLMAAALNRVPAAAPPVARDLVKSIGLLSLYGSRSGLLPTIAVLKALYAGGHQVGDLGEAIALLQSKSIALFRRHTGAFTLWEGSDIDLQAEFENARRQKGNPSLAIRLRRVALPRPLVPRRHYIETGTLRWFDVRIVGADPVRSMFDVDKGTPADALVLMLASPELTIEDTVRRAQVLSHPGGKESKPRLVGVPRDAAALSGALDELEAWKWIRENVSGLAGDAVARQEVAARVEVARLALERLVGPSFGLTGHILDPSASRWFHGGKEIHDISGPGSLQSRLSQICKETFHACPPLHNELLNRHRLSSAAARARRELIERIIEKPDEKNLGISGFPPYFAMYQALLKAGGFHESGSICPPTNQEWRPVWREIGRFLDSTRTAPRPVTDLMDTLRRPPFGLRDGPLPVLVALALAVKAEEAALYEEGVFVSDSLTEAMERLVRRPETFALGSHRLDETEEEILRAIERIRVDGDETLTRGLLGVVRKFVGLAASLPPYARRTRRISKASQLVRDRLLQAKDPRALLFQELPEVLGVSLSKHGAAERFSAALGDAVRDQVTALPRLLDEVEETTRQAFGLVARGEHLRRQLCDRASALVLQAGGAASVFVRTLAMTDASRDWREDVARAAAGGKPPAHWSDFDANAFALRLRKLGVEMERLEALLLQRGGDAMAKVFRLEVLAPERAQLFSGILAGETSAPVEALAKRLNQLASDSGLDDRSQLTALLFAAVKAHTGSGAIPHAVKERSA